MEPKVWFTSDTHYGHANIIKYCNRPFADVYAMNRALIERHNAVVAPFDTVIHLGDFALGPTQEYANYLKKLNGKRKVLVRGNHDRSPKFMKEVGFTEVYEKWEYQGWMLQHHPEKTTKKLLCGHIHQHWRRLGWTINVGVDVWDFTPRSLEELAAAIPDRETDYTCYCGARLSKLNDNQDHYECRRTYRQQA